MYQQYPQQAGYPGPQPQAQPQQQYGMQYPGKQVVLPSELLFNTVAWPQLSLVNVFLKVQMSK